jgi:hypothetical protein
LRDAGVLALITVLGGSAVFAAAESERHSGRSRDRTGDLLLVRQAL